jgi:hypothetical protein
MKERDQERSHPSLYPRRQTRDTYALGLAHAAVVTLIFETA